MFHKRRVLATINSTKHLFQHTPVNVAAAAILTNIEADSVQLPTVANANDVRAGSVIKAISLEYWISSLTTSSASFVITIEKAKGGQPLMTVAQAVNLNTYPNKANILYTTQGFVGGNINNNSVPLLKQWIAIPKGKQRFALGDQLRTNIHSITQGLSLCGIAIYKEYY